MYPAEFANVYDVLMDDVDYPAWAAYYAKLTGLLSGMRALECGCGTGSMTLELGALGISMIGSDISNGMLRVAAEKARARGMRALFIRQDMCRIQLSRGVDAVVAPCDGVNYLLSDERVDAFLHGAYRALVPGGRIAFDVSTPGKLRAMAGQTYFDDRDDISYFWVNEQRGDRLHMALTFFARAEHDMYRRFDEAQVQRAHTMDALTGALERAGFTDIAVLGDRTFEAARDSDARWHFRANRPNLR